MEKFTLPCLIPRLLHTQCNGSEKRILVFIFLLCPFWLALKSCTFHSRATLALALRRAAYPCIAHCVARLAATPRYAAQHNNIHDTDQSAATLRSQALSAI